MRWWENQGLICCTGFNVNFVRKTLPGDNLNKVIWFLLMGNLVWHFKYFMKVKFFSQNSHCHSCVFKFKIKSDFKFHIKTKHVQMFFMLCFYVNLNIRFSFEFGNTHRTICNAIKLKVILKMSLSSSLFYWDQGSLGWSSRGCWSYWYKNRTWGFLRFYFYITNINNLDLIIHGFLFIFKDVLLFIYSSRGC